MSAPAPRLYFAYGSNLSPTQMALRCPSSKPVGLAHLPRCTFIINERHYANVVPDPAGDGSTPDPTAPGVYGVLYTLPPDDEAALDRYEGVPFAYEKEVFTVSIVETADPDTLPKNRSVPSLVYIDRDRVSGAAPWPEYVDRMNRGVDEATARFALPASYVEHVIRKWIPAPTAPLDAAAIEDPFRSA